ncbi:MAG: PAS domain-containing protein [Hyphomicrobium sp.]|nr:PAS domain-containing protein [Hyphomicrobium sp.]
MVDRIRQYNWSQTPLGPISDWPERLRVAVEICVNSGFASWVCWGPELIQIYNDASLATVGAKHPAALGSPARDSWSDIWEVSGPLLERVMRTGEAIRGDDSLFRPVHEAGPEDRYFTFCYSPLYDDSGQIAGVFIVSLDTTNRTKNDRLQDAIIERLRLSEAQMHAGEERLRLALDAAKMGIWVWDIVEGTYIWNDQFFRILGYEPGTVEPGHAAWARRVHPDDLPQLEAKIPSLLEKGEDLYAEHRVLGQNDNVRWVESWGRFASDAGGRPIRYFGVVADITERKKSEQELRASEERLRLALDAAEMGIWEWDVQTGELAWTAQNYILLGLEPYAVTPSFESWAQRVHPDDLPRLLAEAEAMLQAPREVYSQYRAFGKNGEVRWLETRGRYECAPDGRPKRYYGVLIDITERKQAEERDRILTAEVNHRAKNLLAVVQSVALQTARIDDPRAFAQNFSDRLSGLAASHDLLVQSHWSGVDIAELLRSQLSHFADLIGNRILLSGPPAELNASAAQIVGMAAHELATNASKHGALSSPKGCVRVTWNVETADGLPRFKMQWMETNGPPVTPPNRRGFGHSILVDMAEYSLSAEVNLSYPQTGLLWQLSAHAKEVLAKDK